MDGNFIKNEEKWQELGREMNRDWEEIHKAYLQWQKDDPEPILRDKIEQEDIDPIENDMDSISLNDFQVINNNIKSCNEDEIQYVNINGELIDVDNFENYLLHDTDVFNATVYDNQDVVEIRKRRLDLNDFDIELLKTFEMQSHEELKLKRKEHENKMNLYKMQLEFATEVHKEKMKIMKTKLQIIQEQMYHLDHVICNKRLRKKFKSGPI